MAVCQFFVVLFLIFDINHLALILHDIKLWTLMSATVLTAAAGYIINDYYDIKIDVLNKPKRVIIGRYISRRQALLLHTVLNILAFGLSATLGKIIFLATVLSAFLLWLYSNRLKRIAFYGNATVALLTAMAVFLPSLLYRQQYQLVGVFATFAFFISLIREIIKDMEDMIGDRQHGCETLPIRFGIRKTKRIIYLIQVIFVVLIFTLSSQIENRLLYFYIILSLPFMYLVYVLYKADTRKDFNFLSGYCKVLMLAGILSMVLV